MAVVWLDADQVAMRLGIARRTAMSLMAQMPHTVLSGTVRKRIRVSEEALDAWMIKRSTGGRPAASLSGGSRKRLERK